MRKNVDWLELLLLIMASVIVFKVIFSEAWNGTKKTEVSTPTKIEKVKATPEVLPVPQCTPEVKLYNPAVK